MGWRFRRSFKIAPGVRWNLGLRGSSFSVGPRGFKLNFSKRGLRRTVSIPGTGISHSQMLGGPAPRKRAPIPQQSFTPAVLDPSPSTPPSTYQDSTVASAPLTDESAVSAASRWAIGRFPMIGHSLASAVTEVQRTPVVRDEVIYTVLSRAIVVRSSPVARKIRTDAELASPVAFDPWAPDIQGQLKATEGIVKCFDCAAVGKRTCHECSGTITIECDNCGGSGSAISDRTGKIIKCRSCKGDGRKSCPCRDGIITCPTCNGKTAVTAWLALEESRREENRVDGHATLVGAPEEALRGMNVSTSIQWRGGPLDAPSEVREILSNPALAFAADPRRERGETVSVQRLESERVAVDYALANTPGAVKIEAWSGVVRPTPTSEEPFRAVRRRLRWAWLGALVAGYVLCGWFAGRHWYFQDHPTFGILMLAPFALAAALTLPVLNLSRPNKGLVGILASAIPLVAICVGQGVLIANADPSLVEARTHRAADNSGRALREARAVWELRGDPAAAKLHDDVQLESLEAVTEPAKLWPLLEDTYFITPDAKNAATLIGLNLASNRRPNAGAWRSSGKSGHAGGSARSVPGPSIPSRACSQRTPPGSHCRLEHDSVEEPISERLAACRAIEAPRKALGSTFQERGGPAEKQIDSACALLEKEEVARQRKELARQERDAAAALTAQLAAERAQRASARREAAALESRTYAPLLCRDGTLSPSCVCGGSRRGCCSHHGGVAACSK